LAIGNAAVVEGHSGQRYAQFVVTLSTPSSGPVTAHFATGDASATAGSDYGARAGTLTIPAGDVSRILQIPISGDSVHEGDESFIVTLTNPFGATIAHGTGTATILDDD
jgi:chitinase